jgi:hypothetical protein
MQIEKQLFRMFLTVSIQITSISEWMAVFSLGIFVEYFRQKNPLQVPPQKFASGL